MKKIILFLFLCVLSSIAFSSYRIIKDDLTYHRPQQGEISIGIFPVMRFYEIGEEIQILGRIENKTDKAFFIEPLDGAIFNIYNENNENIDERDFGDDMPIKEPCGYCIDNEDRIYEGLLDLSWWYDFPEQYVGKYVMQSLFPIFPENMLEGSFTKYIQKAPLGYLKSNTVTFSIMSETDFCFGEVTFNPHKWNMQWRSSEPEGLINCWIGDIEGYSVKDIDTEEIYLNGYVRPVYAKVVKKHKGFDGKVLHLKFKHKDVIWAVGEVMYDKEMQAPCTGVNIQGVMTDGKVFETETKVEILNPKFGRSE
ncbi:hypothetical protein KAU32_11475 [bacterium]|nr:hypothetical protein [bacterium]